jgi:flagellar basal-body rod protein FlgC
MNDFISSMVIAASGMHAQNARMTVIAENLANADSAGKTPTDTPYRRKVPTFQALYDSELGATKVAVGKVSYDNSAFQSRFEPGHPAADAKGYVRYPNVDPQIEAMDMREAQRTYEANLNVITATRQMLGQTLSILKG